MGHTSAGSMTQNGLQISSYFGAKNSFGDRWVSRNELEEIVCVATDHLPSEYYEYMAGAIDQ